MSVESPTVDILSRYQEVGGDMSPEALSRSLTVTALTEVIQSRRESPSPAPPSPTEYFAAIMTALQGRRSPQRVPLLFLLSSVLPHLPAAILQTKAPQSLSSIISLLKEESENHNKDDDVDSNKIIRYCFTSIGVLLAAQPSSKAIWDSKPILTQAVLLVLNSVADERPKVRKVAQQSMMTVLEQQVSQTEKKGDNRVVARTVCEATLRALEQVGINECTDAARLVHFIKLATPILAKAADSGVVKKLAKQLVDTVRLGHAVLAKSSFETVQIMVDVFATSHYTSLQKRAAVVKEVATHLAEVMDDSQKQKFICSNDALCNEWITTTKRAESTLYSLGQSGELDRTETCIDVVSDSFVACMGAGLRIALQKGKPAVGLPQVIIPVGALASLLYEQPQLNQRPELLAKVWTSLDTLLTPQFEDSWPISLELIRAFFVCRSHSTVAPSSSDSLVEAENEWVRKLVTIREKSINPVTGMDHAKVILKWKTAMERAVGGAIASFGPERFLKIVPLQGQEKDAKGIAPVRTWLLPILRSSIGTGQASATLAFFRSYILRLAQESLEQSRQQGVGVNTSKMLETRAMQLWSLLPAFCTKTKDVSAPAGFPSLAPILGSTLENPEFPDLIEYICQGLNTLIAGCSDSEQDKTTIAGFAENFLPLLFNLYDQLLSSGKREQADFVHSVVRAYTSIASQQLVNNMFKVLVQQLIVSSSSAATSAKPSKSSNKVSQARKVVDAKSDSDDDSDDDDGEKQAAEEEEENEEDVMELDDEEKRKIFVLTSLSLAIIPALDKDSSDLLFRVIRPFVENEEDQTLQKRGYKVLEALCENQVQWVLGKRVELLEVVQDSFFAASASSKTARLKCMEHIIKAICSPDSGMNVDSITTIVSDMVGEVILCTKETNKKARSVGYKLIVEINSCMEAVFTRDGRGADGIKQYLLMLAAALAAKTPHMRSASLNALCRVISVVGKREELQEDLIQIAQAGMVLGNENSREVAKSVISLCKVVAIRLPTATVVTLLPDLLAAVLPWANDTKNRYSKKIRIIMERLWKRIGEDAIYACNIIPEDHALLAYIRRNTAYKKRRYEKRVQGEGAGTQKGRRRHRQKESDGDDSDGEESDRGAVSRKRGRGRDADEEDIIMDEGGEAFDLLGASALGRVKRSARNGKAKGQQGDENKGFTLSSDGRIVIPGEKPIAENNDSDEDDDMEEGKRKRHRYASSDDEDGGDSSKSRKAIAEKRKNQAPGAEFKSNKAGGDVKKKSAKFEPYAYIQLNPKMLNKRRKHESARQFKGITGKKTKPARKGRKAN